MKVEHEQGYLIVANNSETVDYVKCATVCAKSIKTWHPDAKVCILTNEKVKDSVFDIVKPFPYRTAGGYLDDWQVFYASPFRETVKLEADMLITGPINHWWTMLRHRDVVVSTGALDYKGNRVTVDTYRKVFSRNNLPDVYNAFTYWRLSQFSKQFFDTVKDVFKNWNEYTGHLSRVPDQPDTDLVYAITATILGVENCTLPQTSYPRIVHMKNAIAKTPREWYKSLTWEIDSGQVRVNGYTQSPVWHYHYKQLTDKFEQYYE